MYDPKYVAKIINEAIDNCKLKELTNEGPDNLDEVMISLPYMTDKKVQQIINLLNGGIQISEKIKSGFWKGRRFLFVGAQYSRNDRTSFVVSVSKHLNEHQISSFVYYKLD